MQPVLTFLQNLFSLLAFWICIAPTILYVLIALCLQSPENLGIICFSNIFSVNSAKRRNNIVKAKYTHTTNRSSGKKEVPLYHYEYFVNSKKYEYTTTELHPKNRIILYYLSLPAFAFEEKKRAISFKSLMKLSLVLTGGIILWQLVVLIC